MPRRIAQQAESCIKEIQIDTPWERDILPEEDLLGRFQR
jgi:hypothetical protein